MFIFCAPWAPAASDELKTKSGEPFVVGENHGNALFGLRMLTRQASEATMSTDDDDIDEGYIAEQQQEQRENLARQTNEATSRLSEATDSSHAEDALRSLHSVLSGMDATATSRHCDLVLPVVYDALSRPPSEAPSPLIAAPVLYCFARYNLGFSCRHRKKNMTPPYSRSSSVVSCNRLDQN